MQIYKKAFIIINIYEKKYITKYNPQYLGNLCVTMADKGCA